MGDDHPSDRSRPKWDRRLQYKKGWAGYNTIKINQIKITTFIKGE